jgi:hypothetical protein
LPLWELFARRMDPDKLQVEETNEEYSYPKGERFEDDDTCGPRAKKEEGAAEETPPFSRLPTPGRDTVLHIEIRRRPSWFESTFHGFAKRRHRLAPVLYSAIVPYADPEVFRRSFYFSRLYCLETLPGAVIDETALATVIAKDIGNEDFSLVLDMVAVHLPTGRMVAWHIIKNHKYNLGHQKTIKVKVEEQAGAPIPSNASVYRMRMVNQELSVKGSGAGDKLHIVFAPSIILQPSKENGEEVPPILLDAPIKIRFYDYWCRGYCDEERYAPDLFEAQKCLASTLERFMEIKGLSRHWFILKASRYRAKDCKEGKSG